MICLQLNQNRLPPPVSARAFPGALASRTRNRVARSPGFLTNSRSTRSWGSPCMCSGLASSSEGGVAVDGSQPSNGAQKLDFSVAVFSGAEHVRTSMKDPLESAFTNVNFIEARMTEETAKLAKGFDAVCLFVNDDADAQVLRVLKDCGVKYIAMRCAGFDRVDVEVAKEVGIKVVRVPTYSPRSVAEHALALMFDVSRNLYLAHMKVLIGNYTGSGLVGTQMSGKTFGVVGTGNIGVEFIKLLKGFEGKVLAYDVKDNPAAIEAGATYTELETLLKECDFVSLHVPLLPSTFHILNKERLLMMKPDAILVNVSRGGLIDTTALIEVVEGGHLGGVAMDVFEREGNLFFNDFTRFAPKKRMESWDRQFSVLRALPHVLVTPHMAFLTREALANIADTTVENLKACALGEPLVNEVK